MSSTQPGPQHINQVGTACLNAAESVGCSLLVIISTSNDTRLGQTCSTSIYRLSSVKTCDPQPDVTVNISNYQPTVIIDPRVR